MPETDEILTMHMNAWNNESGGDCQTLFRKIIHAGKALDPATGGQCVHDQIHRSGQVRRIRAKKREPLSRQTLKASPALYTQAVKVTDAVYSLVVDVKALPEQ